MNKEVENTGDYLIHIIVKQGELVKTILLTFAVSRGNCSMYLPQNIKTNL